MGMVLPRGVGSSSSLVSPQRAGFTTLDIEDFTLGWEKVGLYEVKNFGKQSRIFKKVSLIGDEEITVPVTKGIQNARFLWTQYRISLAIEISMSLHRLILR